MCGDTHKDTCFFSRLVKHNETVLKRRQRQLHFIPAITKISLKLKVQGHLHKAGADAFSTPVPLLNHKSSTLYKRLNSWPL